ncbi:response regulator [Catenuloplanes atrovinosus]|uniref:CheY-like chemotaxis protein n=1 Tax=Catenuloplanes atrovinosus TaxID=137266 RepID=A0AAE4CBX9_9ACTN|nr:response regulator [Catenuloplanes atrovinosus]MDR7276015.1 CheY-like chemotaxis protein [Catenuloplanes atrovinosus]
MASILVAEDDDDVRMVVMAGLHRAGHSCTAAANGHAAWEAAAAQTPDLLVSDIDMPVMDGLSLCAKLRSDPRLARVPVILMSGSIIPGDERMVRVDATSCLRKPFTLTELRNCVARALTAGHQPGTTSTCS